MQQQVTQAAAGGGGDDDDDDSEDEDEDFDPDGGGHCRGSDGEDSDGEGSDTSGDGMACFNALFRCGGFTCMSHTYVSMREINCFMATHNNTAVPLLSVKVPVMHV